jgi:hypothetical protein
MFSWSLRARCALLPVVLFAALCESAPAQQISERARLIGSAGVMEADLRGFAEVRSQGSTTFRTAA